MIMVNLPSSGGVMKALASSNNITSKRKIHAEPAFDLQAFLDSAGVARKIVEFQKKTTIFAQGDAATHVMYIQQGGVRAIRHQ
jgi:CRP-like cAMP-binding protein